MDCDDEMELDMSMVIPGSDNDADMICCSTPPSPPPPPSLPVRQRRISNAPLTIPRTLSPAMSARSMDGASTSGCEDALDDLDSLDSALSRVHSRVHSRAQSPQSQHQQEKQQKQTRQQQGQSSQQQQQQQRSPHSGGSFNARLAQTMEAFGFTGSAKTSLLLRLRAAAAAKSTGRQQAVAPYMLYRNSGGSVSGSGSVGGSSKRSKALASIDEDDSLSSAASGGVRKRARVVRIPRVKPLAKAKAKARSVPDASVVMRLASAIYNHTLNMATLAQAQRQSAAASSAEAAAVSASTASALVSATTKASVSAAPAGSKTAVAAAALSSSASARLSATSRAQSPVVRNAGTNSPGAGAVRPPPQRYGSPAQQQQQQQQQQRRVSSPMGQRAPVRPGTAPATPHQNGQPLQYRPGATPTRPPLRRPVMQPGGMAGSGASSPGNTGSSPRVMQQRPTMVRRPPPNGVPHTPPAGGAMRPGHPVRPPTPGSAGQHMRPLQRPTGTSPSTPLRRPPPPSAQHAGAQQPHQQGARPGVPSPRPSPGRPLVGANGMALRPRPPMPNGARPRPAMARQPPLTHPPPGSSGAHVRPGLGVIGAIAGNSSGARPQQQQQQQAYSAQGPVTPVTPSSFSSAAGQQTGAVRPKHLPPHKPQPQPQHQPHCHPQLPKTPVSATAASFARPTGTSAVPPPPSPSAAPAAPVSAPVAPSPVANKNAD
ncbi:hypothetical protein LPJ75_003676 [Coemansia sp. RSA 2598]|nr:hypothetical protein LPJ75_003676 [Coemansia sp. RSA 2598]